MNQKTPIQLTRSQREGLDCLQDGRENIFLTGGPGTGKSFLIREFLKTQEKEIPVIASTGAAAILVGGRTFHSFFGLGIMQGGERAVLERARKDRALKKRLRRASTVVIDEVSMLSASTFDCAERIAREVRKADAPWGGIRVIAVGDFAQLPPISKAPTKEWAFLGRAWLSSNFRKVTLQEVVRSRDRKFIEVLEEIRWGGASEKVHDFLNGRMVASEEVEMDVPHIFPRRVQTEAFNRMKLESLSTAQRTYVTEYGGQEVYVRRLRSDAPIPPVLELKEGALVMLRMNDPKQRYVNGTVGTLRTMYEARLIVEVGSRLIDVEPYTFTLLNADGEEVAYARNFPVNLAYGSTIHKVQGATLERVHIDLKSLWEPGQAYVALSRARTSGGITLSGWEPASIIADPSVRSFYGRGLPEDDEACIVDMA